MIVNDKSKSVKYAKQISKSLSANLRFRVICDFAAQKNNTFKLNVTKR